MARGQLKRKDLTGTRIHRLVVLEFHGHTPQKQAVWKCLCDCGNTTLVRGYVLRQGKVKSCGCAKGGAGRKKHGMAGKREYEAYHSMLGRCYNEGDVSYQDYGGRGIRVCERWLGDEGFCNFLADMGPAPPGLSLDRKECNADYSLDNCRWVSRKTQGNNKRNNVILEHEGRRQTLGEWASEIGLSQKCLYFRIFQHGWTVGDAISTPGGQPRGKRDCRPDMPPKLKNRRQARRAVHVETRTGRMKRPSCCSNADCQRVDVQAHHHNGYEQERWLDVVWLCPAHHPKPNELSVTANGKTMSFREWSRETGIPLHTLRARLRCGWSPEKTVGTPLGKHKTLLTFGGKTRSIREWSATIGVTQATIINRIKKGLSIELVLSSDRNPLRRQEVTTLTET